MKSFIAAAVVFGFILGDSSAFADNKKSEPAEAECTYYQNTNRGEIKTHLLAKGEAISFQVDDAHRANKYTNVHIKMIQDNEISLITTSFDEDMVFSSTSFQLGSGFEHYVNITGDRHGFLNIKCVPVKK